MDLNGHTPKIIYRYEYSHTNYRLWRKNRRINSGNSCKGVDLNRNWGYQWGGAGASTNPCRYVKNLKRIKHKRQ